MRCSSRTSNARPAAVARAEPRSPNTGGVSSFGGCVGQRLARCWCRHQSLVPARAPRDPSIHRDADHRGGDPGGARSASIVAAVEVGQDDASATTCAARSEATGMPAQRRARRSSAPLPGGQTTDVATRRRQSAVNSVRLPETDEQTRRVLHPAARTPGEHVEYLPVKSPRARARPSSPPVAASRPASSEKIVVSEKPE